MYKSQSLQNSPLFKSKNKYLNYKTNPNSINKKDQFERSSTIINCKFNLRKSFLENNVKNSKMKNMLNNKFYSSFNYTSPKKNSLRLNNKNQYIKIVINLNSLILEKENSTSNNKTNNIELIIDINETNSSIINKVIEALNNKDYVLKSYEDIEKAVNLSLKQAIKYIGINNTNKKVSIYENNSLIYTTGLNKESLNKNTNVKPNIENLNTFSIDKRNNNKKYSIYGKQINSEITKNIPEDILFFSNSSEYHKRKDSQIYYYSPLAKRIKKLNKRHLNYSKEKNIFTTLHNSKLYLSAKKELSSLKIIKENLFNKIYNVNTKKKITTNNLYNKGIKLKAKQNLKFNSNIQTKNYKSMDFRHYRQVSFVNKNNHKNSYSNPNYSLNKKYSNDEVNNNNCKRLPSFNTLCFEKKQLANIYSKEYLNFIRNNKIVRVNEFSQIASICINNYQKLKKNLNNNYIDDNFNSPNSYNNSSIKNINYNLIYKLNKESKLLNKNIEVLKSENDDKKFNTKSNIKYLNNYNDNLMSKENKTIKYNLKINNNKYSSNNSNSKLNNNVNYDICNNNNNNNNKSTINDSPSNKNMKSLNYIETTDYPKDKNKICKKIINKKENILTFDNKINTSNSNFSNVYSNISNNEINNNILSNVDILPKNNFKNDLHRKLNCNNSNIKNKNLLNYDKKSNNTNSQLSSPFRSNLEANLTLNQIANDLLENNKSILFSSNSNVLSIKKGNNIKSNVKSKSIKKNLLSNKKIWKENNIEIKDSVLKNYKLSEKSYVYNNVLSKLDESFDKSPLNKDSINNANKIKNFFNSNDTLDKDISIKNNKKIISNTPKSNNFTNKIESNINSFDFFQTNKSINTKKSKSNLSNIQANYTNNNIEKKEADTSISKLNTNNNFITNCNNVKEKKQNFKIMEINNNDFELDSPDACSFNRKSTNDLRNLKIFKNENIKKYNKTKNKNYPNNNSNINNHTGKFNNLKNLIKSNKINSNTSCLNCDYFDNKYYLNIGKNVIYKNNYTNNKSINESCNYKFNPSLTNKSKLNIIRFIENNNKFKLKESNVKNRNNCNIINAFKKKYTLKSEALNAKLELNNIKTINKDRKLIDLRNNYVSEKIKLYFDNYYECYLKDLYYKIIDKNCNIKSFDDVKVNDNIKKTVLEPIIRVFYLEKLNCNLNHFISIGKKLLKSII